MICLDDSEELRAGVHVSCDTVSCSGCVQMQSHSKGTSRYSHTETHKEKVKIYIMLQFYFVGFGKEV